MFFVKILLIFIEVVTSTLLVAVILVQKTKDEGLGLAFGGGVGESLFGSRTGNVLTKITITLSIIFLVNTTLLALMAGGQSSTGSLVERMPAGTARPAQAAPMDMPQPRAGGEPSAAPAVPAENPVAAPAGQAAHDVPAPAAPPAAPAAPAPEK